MQNSMAAHRSQHTAPSLTLLVFSNAVNVYLPKDRVTNAHQGFGFVEFRGEDDADYVSSMHAGRESALHHGPPAWMPCVEGSCQPHR